MKRTLWIVLLLAATLAIGGDKHVPHSTVTYIIVPVKDIDKTLLDLVAQTSTNTLRRSTNGLLAVLEFVEYKDKADPMPPVYSNDVTWTKEQLEYNEKLEKYPWAAKETPDILREYRQYTHAQILVEMSKPEWTAGTVITNGAEVITP